MHIVFNHGKESGPNGSKIQALGAQAEELGHSTASLDYTDLPDDPEARVERLVAYVREQTESVALVGSSMGSYVAAVASMKAAVQGLFLLAPAFYIEGFAVQDYSPHAKEITLVHGYADEIIPFQHSVTFGERHGAEVHLLPGDHRLKDAMPRIHPLFGDFLNRLG